MSEVDISATHRPFGDGSKTTQLAPVAVTVLGKQVAAVAVGYDHSCALKSDGTVWCWGSNTSGQLGDGTFNSSLAPVAVATLGNTVTQIDAGAYHTCALKSDGSLWCWGANSQGQLGDGTVVNRATPTQLSLAKGVTRFSTGTFYTCAREADSSLWCWGDIGGWLYQGTRYFRLHRVVSRALDGRHRKPQNVLRTELDVLYGQSRAGHAERFSSPVAAYFCAAASVTSKSMESLAATLAE